MGWKIHNFLRDIHNNPSMFFKSLGCWKWAMWFLISDKLTYSFLFLFFEEAKRKHQNKIYQKIFCIKQIFDKFRSDITSHVLWQTKRTGIFLKLYCWKRNTEIEYIEMFVGLFCLIWCSGTLAILHVQMGACTVSTQCP